MTIKKMHLFRNGKIRNYIRRLAISFFAVVCAASCLAAKDAIKDGVHGYTPAGYVQPTEPEVLERLEWFKDQKLALMMHFGLYSTIGIRESWPLCDKDARWSQTEVTWTKDINEFKRQYLALNKVFNPLRFEPEKWAETAKRNGFKYVIFTTKHHDGFCLYDSKYSDFKVTAPECPFSTDKRADIVKHVFDAFRKEGLGIAAYFSKPDWHNEDYWEDKGVGRFTDRNPTYDIKKHPEKWARFREYTKNQILELVRDYGKIDIIWLDGGQVQRATGQDINIEDIIAEARKYNPALISVDRTAKGPCENVVTPEQTVPATPLAVPWESCITIGKYWPYHFDDEYKSVRELVHMLIDVVAKGGNLALNIGPQPDGRLPHQAVERIDALGEWLKANGEAIYETRPLPPFRSGDWAFTRNRRTGAEYAIRLWKEGEVRSGFQTIPGVSAARVVHVASGRSFSCTTAESNVSFMLPGDFKSDVNADVFQLLATSDAKTKTNPVVCTYTFNVVAWRGETVVARVPDHAELAPAPKGIGVRYGVMQLVKFAPWVTGLQRLEAFDRVVWDTSLDGPRVVEVSVPADAKPGVYSCGIMRVHVVDRVLPPPSQWKYYLDLWQHPWACARMANATPFSKEHYDAMRPVYELLASAGQKAITVTIVDLPWNHQCADAYHSMIDDPDFKTFDEYVEFCRECGLGPDISCYSLCPWTLGKTIDEDELEKLWGEKFDRFVAHLKKKGWFEHTVMAMDERAPEDVAKVASFVQRHAPGMRISMAGNRNPADFKGIKIDIYSQILEAPRMTSEFLAEARERAKKGFVTTHYVCCGPKKPNTFIESSPGEAFWCGVAPAFLGLDGFLRWAWNSWPQNPVKDATFGYWPAGDTFLCYPGGEPSWRFLELRNGIIAAEKIRILRDSGELDEKKFKDLAARYDVKSANDGTCDYMKLRTDTINFTNQNPSN